MRVRDLSGKQFGKLEVIKRVPNTSRVKWLCKCICGNEVVVQSGNLLCGNTKSCGCYKKEKTKETKTKHGESKTRLYRIWAGMKCRTCNNKSPIFSYYGGRGIRVCNEWESSYKNFSEWAKDNGYNDELTLDRIDNNGNYEPKNCRWITKEEQANNRRSNHLLTHAGETHTIKEWSVITGINYGTLRNRARKYGDDTERIFASERRTT